MVRFSLFRCRLFALFRCRWVQWFCRYPRQCLVTSTSKGSHFLQTEGAIYHPFVLVLYKFHWPWIPNFRRRLGQCDSIPLRHCEHFFDFVFVLTPFRPVCRWTYIALRFNRYALTLNSVWFLPRVKAHTSLKVMVVFSRLSCCDWKLTVLPCTKPLPASWTV